MPRTAKPENLGPNRWRIRWHDHAGKRRSKLYTSFDAAQRALRAHQATTDEIRHGLRPKPPEDHTFDELATYWETHVLPTKRSRKDDMSIVRAHLRPAFGPLLLRQITTERADAFISARAHLAPFTVRNHRALLLAMLKKAVSLGWLARVPEVRAPRIDPDDEDDAPRLTQEEIERLLVAARGLIWVEDPYSEIPHVLYAVAAFSGLRAGELAGLRWPDVDLERRTIHVRRSYDGKTKTRSSRRFVPVVDALLPILKAWKHRCPGSDLDLVFPNRAGRTRGKHDRVFRATLHKVLDAAGFERPTIGRHSHVICFHSLRHSFACNWRLNGGSLEALVRVLGHTSQRMTEHYANIGGYHRPEHFRLFPDKG
jgi:integrase